MQKLFFLFCCNSHAYVACLKLKFTNQLLLLNCLEVIAETFFLYHFSLLCWKLSLIL